MKNKTIKLFFLILILISGVANSQEDLNAEKKIKKNSIALYGGLPGFALGYGRLLNEHLSLRLNGSTFSYSTSINEITLGDRTVDVEGDYKFRAIDLLLEYLPFKKSSFKLVGGLSYLLSTKVSGVIKPTEGATYGDIILTKEQIGEINVDADWSGIAPYIATGFGRTIPKKNFGFGFEIGGHFVGKPDFTFDATKSLTPTVENEKESHEFQSWVDQIVFIPTVVLHLNYKF